MVKSTLNILQAMLQDFKVLKIKTIYYLKYHKATAVDAKLQGIRNSNYFPLLQIFQIIS